MKAVILLAGYGGRLNVSIPKSLVKFSNGECLLQYQLKALIDLIPLHDIHMVVGFKKELIMEAAPQCTFLYNQRFDQTNTAKSLLLAVERLDDDILWLNGDVFVDKGIIKELTLSSGNLVLVDQEAVADEEVCYTTDSKGHIQRLAKGLGVLAEGEALGINKIQRDDVQTLKTLLEKVDDQDYFEKAIELGIENGLFSFSPIKINNKFVKEMDFQSDYELIDHHLMNKG